MTPRRSPAALLAAALGLALLAGCAPEATTLEVTGTVGDEVSTVSVPPVTTTVAGVAAVKVAVGDTVAVGQVLARLDDSALQASLALAKADKAVAHAQVDRLAAAIDETEDAAVDLADKREEITDAIHTLTQTRHKLVKARAKLHRVRPRLVTQLYQALDLLANYPPVPVPGLPTQEELRKGIRKLKTGLHTIDAGLAKIRRGLPKLDAGLHKARNGLKKLDDVEADLADAQGTLDDLNELAVIAAEASQVPVDLVRIQLDLLGLRSPVNGVVVQVADLGAQLAPGATIATIREDAPSTVTAWLSPTQLGSVCLGTPARITTDSGTTADATLTRIGTSAEYPPTSVPTDEVHLTRAVEVEFTAATQLPAGIGVDLSIDPCGEKTP